MTIARVTCTCATCGKQFSKEKKFHKSPDATEWESWASGYYDMCPSCYLKAHPKQSKIYLSARFNLYQRNRKSAEDCAIAYIIEGDTRSYIDKLKRMGAIYTDEYPSSNSLNDTIDYKSSYKAWVIYSNLNNMENVFDDILTNFGAFVRSCETPTQADLDKYHEIMNSRKKLKEEMDQEISALGYMPEWPKEIKSKWTQETFWNGKFYGKSGKWSIYLNGEKIDVSDQLKDQIEMVVDARKIWCNQKEEILEKYKKMGVN